MRELLQQALHSNQFVSGGLVLMLTGSVLALFRNVPIQAWNGFKDFWMVRVSVDETDPLFDWITLWLHRHPYTKRARSLSAITEVIRVRKKNYVSSEDDSVQTDLPEIIFSPSKGEHFFIYRGKLVWLTRGEEEGKGAAQPTKSDSSKGAFKRPEKYWFRTVGRSQSLLRDLLNDVLEATRQDRESKISTYVSNYGYWQKLSYHVPRPLASVFLPEQREQTLVCDMEEFLGDREWYERRGIPYRRGYLFYGPPGNGKTSIISALAGALKLNLYSLNLSDGRVNDSDLSMLVRQVQPRSIVLFEDIDAAMHNREPIVMDEARQSPVADDDDEKKERGVTLSGLLNVLDGVLTPEGLLVVMTTNYRERLDKALIRPGRVDKSVEFVHSTLEQRIRAFEWFYPERGRAAAVEFGLSFKMETSMAEVQQALMALKKRGNENEERVDGTTDSAWNDGVVASTGTGQVLEGSL